MTLFFAKRSWFHAFRSWLTRPANNINRQLNRRVLQIDALEERLTPATNLQLLAQALPAQPWVRTGDGSYSLVIVNSDLARQIPAQEYAGANVLVLDSTRDVINQITLQLSHHPGITNIRIISHGADGTLLLGNQQIDESILQARSKDIAAWGQFLSSGADMLLYGCSVASTTIGRNFVDTLSILIGADIAASTNKTGAGADTILEYTTGIIETEVQAHQAA